jgi:hypothetical protein
MQELLDALPNGTTATLAVLIGLAWRFLAGQKASQYAARVREIARAAFALAATVGDRTPEQLADVAKIRARAMLARLKIPFDDAIAALLEHELDLLAAKERERERAVKDAQQRILASTANMERASKEMKGEWDRLERDAAGNSVLDGMDVTVLCPEPRCQRKQGHAGPHGVEPELKLVPPTETPPP